MRAINLFVLVIAFATAAMVTSAQSSFTITVGPSPVSITTTTTSSIVTVKEQNANPNSYYITDPNVGATQFLIQAGSPYTFSSAGGYPSGTVVGTIKVANNVTTQFLVTETGTGGSPARITVQPSTCPANQSISAINGDGSVVCSNSGGGGSGSVTSVSGTTNQIDVATGTTTPVVSIDPAFIFPGTVSSKIINGVSYSALYTGASLDARVNPCVVDAETLANGNQTGICSSYGEPSILTSAGVNSTITVGDSFTNAVTWQVPAACNWLVNMGGSGTPVILEWAGARITGIGGRGAENSTNGHENCFIQLASGGESYMFQTAGVGRFTEDGLSFKDGSHSLTGGAVMIVGGSPNSSFAEDESYFGHISVSNQSNSNNALIVGNACCTTTFDNFEVNGVYTGLGQIVINAAYSVFFRSLSADHPPANKPIIQCNGGNDISIFGLYEETYAGQMTSPVNDISGCSNVGVYGQTVNPLNSGAVTSTPVWQIESGTATSFEIQGLQASQGSMTTPFVAVNNLANGTSVPVDANGNLSSYSSNVSYGDTIQALLGFLGPTFTTNGTTAAFMDFAQGASSASIAPCNSVNSWCVQAAPSMTAGVETMLGTRAQGTLFGLGSSTAIQDANSGDANHSAAVTIGSGTSIGSTALCSSANCPAGTYRVNAYLDITTACATSGTYLVDLIYTDDQGTKTIPVNLNGTGAVPATGVLTTTSTSNFGQVSQPIRLTSGGINYSTTAVACGSAGPMVGKMYMSVEAVQ